MDAPMQNYTPILHARVNYILGKQGSWGRTTATSTLCIEWTRCYYPLRPLLGPVEGRDDSQEACDACLGSGRFIKLPSLISSHKSGFGRIRASLTL